LWRPLSKPGGLVDFKKGFFMRFQKFRGLMSATALIYCAGLAQAGSNVVTDAIDPDCTVEKAAKGAAMKATVGV
jgi:hypothetical protein